jgi:two-component system NtrC family sensor kinase
MKTRLGRPFDSLAVRLLASLFLVVAVVLGIYAVFSFGATKRQLLGMVSDSAVRSSDLIRRATHDGMLLNRLDEVQSTIERLAESEEIEAIRVLDTRGNIVLSAPTEEIGQRVEPESSLCMSCHYEGAESSQVPLLASNSIELADGRHALCFTSAIENEPSCAAAECHAHPAESRVLGVLEVDMSMAPLESTLEQARWQLVRATLVLVGVLGVVATVFVRRGVGRPLAELQGATRRIASGDLDSRIEVHGHTEIARLAESFNQMSDDLQAARREVTEWSEKLEDKVLEKTAELQQTQRHVLHMEKMASLGKLATTVAHELNNPLNGVLTYTRLVQRELEGQPIDPETREELGRYLQLMSAECNRCGEIVKNLLLFAHRKGAEFAPIDLIEEMDHSLMLIRHHLEISGIDLRYQPLVSDRQIVADPGQLQQALVALLMNAVEAMTADDGNEGVLSVRIRDSADEVRIDITDTGPGIPAEVLPHIFEPFFSTKEEESRVGLGLAVVYGIVHRHGGTIEVESQPGQGTTFHLQIPRNPRDERADDASPASTDDEERESPT